MFARLLKTRMSKPPSNSVVRSGLRSALPSEFARRPGVSVPLMLTVGAVYVTNASVERGCVPEAPYAARTRNWLRKLNCGKNGSSEAIHDRLAFGYVMLFEFAPNALFWSVR